jgi:hypothetical protein
MSFGMAWIDPDPDNFCVHKQQGALNKGVREKTEEKWKAFW